jgi:UDP-glucose 4-epimerase
VNVSGTVTLMEAMRDVGVSRVILASSGTVYGNQPVQPVSEVAVPNPRSPYAVSKLAAEYYVKSIGSLWGIETVCLRIFNAYGPGQNLPGVHAPVIPGFLNQAWQNGTIVIHGDGNQTRDFVYIDDVVSAMAAAATAEDVNQSILNVGSGSEISIQELVHEVLEVTGGNPEVISNPRNEGGLSRLCADISEAREKLNYRPTMPLAEGLKRTLEYILANKG